MEAGDRVKVSFEIDGGGYVYINDVTYMPELGSLKQEWEGVLTKPIRVETSLCVITMDVSLKGKDGFMSSDDKTRLDNLEASIKSLQEAIKQLGTANN